MTGQGKGPDDKPIAPPAIDPGKSKKSPEQLEREKRIAELFHCTTAKFNGDRIELVYNFESKQEELAEDWSPALKANDRRIRWSRNNERLLASYEDGIVFGDAGEWLHKATFLPDLEVSVEIMSVAQHKAGNLIAPIFHNEKTKRALGSNNGSQVVYLMGGKHAKPPLPKEERVVSASSRFDMGYAFQGGKFEARHRGKRTADTAASPKYIEGFDRGRVGLAWRGSVQCFLFRVTIKGKLDPEWVAKQLGEPSPAAIKEASKKGGSTGSQGKAKANPAFKNAK